VFRFFEQPENLALITPPSLQFRLLTPSPVTMAEGCVIDYRIRLFGLPLRWRSLISSYDPPYFFVDQQLEGPYRYWRHEHQFESADGGTWFVDHVYYRLPPLPSAVERIVHGAYVGPYLKQIFDYRASFYRRFSDSAVAWRPHRLTN
jgi:ligand-binding SRPBCC domain-containing protein